MLNEELYVQIESMKNLLISRATGGKESNVEFTTLRKLILDNQAIEALLPTFIKTCSTLEQFWGFISCKYNTYADRRDYLNQEFQLLINFVERSLSSPADEIITEGLQKIDITHIQSTWEKALERRNSDPEGAITIARTLLETVCKHILDDMEISYDDNADFPKLYRETAKRLNIAPSQHSEKILKQIFSGCVSIIEGLGSLRNSLSDSHGKGKNYIKPEPTHAALAVNLSGTLASYLLMTWESQKTQSDLNNNY
ncbi:hypothetical protein X808_9520 [Mannheimia varigena USDA-ARS-USMARC-1296]|uniref:Abortive infection protein-like C-terminal domain-containing protein n=1 Tax=Mannheimia varigena USDA-ARS-USMARC-1296 TaxID=1433287 RepID=W0QCA7_9PAST|nr:abortive infection family protein [Mannheimia varigena]AHG75475.1 hypothetical protein X808_9520 [Mannheimia varigena USDA-ARS-USMARC-1296]